MSSFSKALNDKKQFIIVAKISKFSEQKATGNEGRRESVAIATPKKALIDTGASNTCITQECANELNLIPISRTLLTTASGDCETHVYMVDLAIPVAITELETIETEEGQKRVQPVVVGEEHWVHIQHIINSIPEIGKKRGFDVILGMDILHKMHITMFGGRIVLSF